MNIFLIACGGGIGAVLRYVLTEYVNNNFSSSFPLGSLSVNILGCFIVGCLAGYFASHASSMYFFLIIGFLGSFTTMSAFSVQTIELLNTNTLNAIVYVILTFSLTIVATYFGLMVVSK